MHGETNTHASSLSVLSHTATPGTSFAGEGLFWQIVSSTNETVPFARSASSTLVEQQLPDSSGNILKETFADIEISATSGKCSFWFAFAFSDAELCKYPLSMGVES